MSLDVFLTGAPSSGIGSGIFIREAGENREITRAEWDARFPGQEPVVSRVEGERVYSRNITHNLGAMAAAAGIYEPCGGRTRSGSAGRRSLSNRLPPGS